MQQYPFIFSDEPRYRLKRHLLFWSAWWIFQGFLYSFISINSFAAYMVRLPTSMAESLVFMTVHIFLSCSLMYFVIPRYLLKQQYWQTAGWAVGLFLLAACMSTTLALTVIPKVRECIMGEEYATRFRTPTTNIFLSLMAGLRGGLTIAGIAAAIKLMKYWSLKEQRNIQLQKENSESQLQLLKAQVHPHFLFNTLNNIYSYTQNTTTVGSKLVIGLSDMLRYMLYECNQPLVPLSTEIKMLKDYCSLEQVRYDEHLDLQINISGDKGELLIAPLLLLPFVENCFKHGASNLLENAWISLVIDIHEDSMKMKLINSKPVDEKHGNTRAKYGIGIANVQTRLNLLYPAKHELLITDEADVFIVNLHLQLVKQSIPSFITNTIKTSPVYARS